MSACPAVPSQDGQPAEGPRPEVPPAPSGFSSTPEEASLPLPRVFGRLILLKRIARGGMGDVYLAATTGIEGAERACVVKTVRRDHVHDGSFLARFLDEARVQSQLNHPGVAQVLEAATDEAGEPYTLVEYVEGRSLGDVRQRAIQLGVRIGWAESLAIGIEVASALAHVHERSSTDGSPLGIVHRDLSPQNVMLGYAGEVKLIDFGTARGLNRRCHTVAGVVFAKPGYVAPEVARQQTGDGRIDIYALGVMIWELCAGRRLLAGDPQKHLEEAAAGRVKIPHLADLVDAPSSLDDLIQKLTANDPDDRYVSASQAVTDMAKLLSSAPQTKNVERSVRGRLSALMRTLWPHEPARSRAEFARLLKDARALQAPETQTPVSARVEIAAQHMNDDPSMLAGTPYKLVAKIGHGASGVVWAGEHVELGRKLAIKVLASGHGSSLERFRGEARAVARLSHPNLVQLYDFGRALDGRVFLAMELLEGQTLAQHLSDSRGMDWREAVLLAIEVCHALEAAHAAGLVHRDLKPANLFLTRDGGAKLLDFGLAMAIADLTNEAGEPRPRGFAVFGTPEYMAPEQVAGEPVDARCDLYALGCVLYELVTGAAPFDGNSPVAIMGKQVREEPEPPRVRAPRRGVPPEVEAVVMTLLAKKPEERFASATELRGALEATLRAPQERQNNVRRNARIALGAALVCGAAASLFVLRARHTSHPDLAWLSPTAATFAATDAPPTAALPVAEPEAKAPPAEVPAAAPAQLEATTAPVAPAAAGDTVASKDLAPPKAPEAATAPAEVHAAAETSVESDRARLERTMLRATHHDAERVPLPEARAYAKAHVDDPHALRTWALAAYRAGALRESRRAADAWALREGTSEPRLFLATVLDASGHHEDAIAVLEQWLDGHPDSADAKRMVARLDGEAPQLETASHRVGGAKR